MGSLKQLAGLNIHLLVVASNTSKQLPESVMYKNLKDLLEAQKCEDGLANTNANTKNTNTNTNTKMKRRH